MSKDIFKQKKEAKPKEKKVEEKKVEETGSGLKKQTRLGLEFKKEDNLSEWYSQVLLDGLFHVSFTIQLNTVDALTNRLSPKQK